MTIFNTKDVFGDVVILRKSTWEGHVIKDTGHPEMRGQEIPVRGTVENPEVVGISAKSPKTDKLFFSRRPDSTYPNLYIRVVVGYADGVGYVRTAHFTPTIQGVTPGGILYVKKNS